MTTVAFPIAGGDYAGAGSASSGVKQMLKRIGAEPETMRRTMVAAYEAEMNVVIHAHRGTLTASVSRGRIDIEVADEGPGIADVDLAMTEGYSTAPAEARALGFGAGLGLPNIRRSSDHFAIHSVVGTGTRVRFSVRLGRQEAAAPPHHSVRTVAAACRQCLQCLRACPTEALRVHGGGPRVLDHLCIDCAACIAACAAAALTLDAPEATPDALRGALLVAPPALLAQFGPRAAPRRVAEALRQLGCRDVATTEPWEAALRQATLDYARTEATRFPVIAPACPAVLNLLELRFPSLLGHVAPFLSPLEAAAVQLLGERAAFVVACPAQRTALASRAGPEAAAIGPRGLCEAVVPLVAARAVGACAPAPPLVGRERARPALAVSGLRHVVAVLDEAENGRLGDVQVLELAACDGGCFGSPLFAEDPFVAERRSSWSARPGWPSAQAVRRRGALRPRPGLRLDADMARAIDKLAQIDQWARRLPGRDCGVCGAPTCRALAEDIVLGRASDSACVHLPGAKEDGT